MSQFLSILNIVLPVFLVIGLGFFLKVIKLVDSGFLFQLNRLIYWVALPSLLFYKIATANFSQTFNGTLVLGLGFSIVLGFILSYGYGVLRGYAPEICGTFTQGAFRGNLAFVGLAIVFNAYGEEGLTKAGILLGFLVPLLNFLAVLALLLPHKGERKNKSIGFWLGQVMLNPLIIASFIGLLWSFLRIPIPLFLDRTLHVLTPMSLPLALIAIGVSFSFKKLQGDLKITLLATTVKLVLLPLIAAFTLYLLGIKGQDFGIGVLFAATPAAAAAYIMAEQMKGDAPLAGSIIMLSTLLSMFSYTIILYILGSFGM